MDLPLFRPTPSVADLQIENDRLHLSIVRLEQQIEDLAREKRSHELEINFWIARTERAERHTPSALQPVEAEPMTYPLPDTHRVPARLRREFANAAAALLQGGADGLTEKQLHQVIDTQEHELRLKLVRA